MHSRTHKYFNVHRLVVCVNKLINVYLSNIADLLKYFVPDFTKYQHLSASANTHIHTTHHTLQLIIRH